MCAIHAHWPGLAYNSSQQGCSAAKVGILSLALRWRLPLQLGSMPMQAGSSDAGDLQESAWNLSFQVISAHGGNQNLLTIIQAQHAIHVRGIVIIRRSITSSCTKTCHVLLDGFLNPISSYILFVQHSVQLI